METHTFTYTSICDVASYRRKTIKMNIYYCIKLDEYNYKNVYK